MSDADNTEKIPLQRFHGLYLKHNPAKGRGVFATQRIPAGTVIDVCPVLLLTPQENAAHIEHTTLFHYTYCWPSTDAQGNTTGQQTQAVILGLGSMFNHSRRRQNVGWQRDVKHQLITYRALRDIDTDEELCISYGDRLTFVDADTPDSDDTELSGSETLSRIQID